jgi:hypothetical protein
MDALRRFFRVFDQGVVFKWIVVCFFVLEGVLLLLVNVLWAYRLVRLLGDARFLEGVGAVVLALALLLAAFLAIVILAYRGAYATATVRAEKYSLLSLVARALRANGEAALFYLLVLAPAGCLATWLSEARLTGRLPFPPAYEAAGTFLLGVGVLLGGILYALVLAFLGYLVAEVCDILHGLAGDVAAIRASKAGVR